MQPGNKTINKQPPPQGSHQNPLPQELSSEQQSLNQSAHTEAEKDMNNDAELTAHNDNDDLDEGETARLGEDLREII